MLEKILMIIKQEKIQHYLINQIQEQSEEVFYIKKNLELKRRKDITKYQVTLYYDFPESSNNQSWRGFASCTLSTAMDDAQLQDTIKSTYLAASYAKNPYFPILSAEETSQLPTARIPKLSMEQLAQALFANDTESDSFINSAELFITTTQHRIINSNGVDVSYKKHLYFGEFVVQSVNQEDVELYQDFSFTDIDPDIPEAIEQLVKKTLFHAKKRSMARPAPDALKPETIILEGSCVKDFFQYFIQRCDASMLYPKYSDYYKGTYLDIPNTPLSITLLPDAPYTSEGIRLREQSLIDNNSIRLTTGDLRFSYYLGVPAAGTYNRFRVTCGPNDFDKKHNLLRIVQFSDFQMDSFTGEFGGEYRLAYYTDETGTELPVTGGSISGNIIKIFDSLLFSKEEQQYCHYTGPNAICYKA